jgi:hypothetical protein
MHHPVGGLPRRPLIGTWMKRGEKSKDIIVQNSLALLGCRL